MSAHSSSPTEARRGTMITGASSGIGEEFARQLAKRGWDLVLVARRAEALNRLGAELEGRHGVRVEVLPADLTDAKDVARVEDRLRGAAGADPVHLLVNNAGMGGGGPFARQDPAEVERILDLNVRALVRLTRAALPPQIALRASYDGPLGVINVSSLAGVLPAMPGGAIYAASKAFVRSFSESVALEAKKFRVNVTAVLPGYVRTEMTQGMQERGLPGPAWVSAERVVVESLRAFAQGRPHVVPGAQYKAAEGLVNLIPSSLLRGAMTGVMKRLS